MMRKHIVLLLHIFLCILFVLLVIWNASKFFDGRPLQPGNDASYHIRTGYNLYKHQTHSLDKEAPFKPTAYREPAPSAFVALIIASNSKLRNIDIDAILAGGDGLEILRYAQLPICIISAFLAMYLVYLLTKNMIYGYIALFLVGFSNSLLFSAWSINTEHLAALFAVCTSISLYKAVKVKSKKYFAFLGISLGLLVLTKGVFIYCIYFLLIFLPLLAKAGVFEKKKILIRMVVLAAAYFALAGSWMVRNYVHFNRFYVTGRGGVIVLVRAEYNTMNSTEYFGSFLWWTPSNYIHQKLIPRFYGENALFKGGALWRLRRNNYETGHLRRATNKRKELMSKSGTGETIAIDKELKSLAKGKVLAHSFRHILTTIPMAWRGIFVENTYARNLEIICDRNFGLAHPFSTAIVNPVAIGLAYFGSLFFLALSGVRKKKWELLAITLPSLYLYGINSFVTHNIPRYNQPIIPVLAVALLFAASLAINKIAGKLKVVKTVDKTAPRKRGLHKKDRHKRRRGKIR